MPKIETKPVFQRARSALDFLEHHQLEPNAANFELALCYIAEPKSELARDIAERVYDGLRLTAEDAHTLRGRHFPEDTSQALALRERVTARQVEELGALTSDAHELTEALGHDVSVIVKQSDEWPIGASGLIVRLTDAERDLAELRDEFQLLRDAIGVPSSHRADVNYDDLTRALNQTGASRVLQQLTENGRSYVIVMFIIDNLSGINNKFGHAVGDNVLNAFAATLRDAFPEVELIRWAGNEYIIAAADLATAAARSLAEDALAALGVRHLKLRGTGEWIGTVTASAGIVVGQREAPEALVARARENALSAAALGGNQIKG